jgi:hypothetical protein
MLARLPDALDALTAAPCCGYRPGAPAATEPTALAALALLAHGHQEASLSALHWLSRHQQPDGSLGITDRDASPAWPTPQAMLAWQAAVSHGQTGFQPALDRAVTFLLAARGVALPRTHELGHDSTLVGWCWADSTHSWVEPTALAVLALTGAGCGVHPRVAEGRRLLADRLLSSGGCNYGNTLVLGQKLRPHVQPTALAMLALTDAPQDERMEFSLRYLERELRPDLATASLSYALMALAAHGRRPTEANNWIDAALHRTLSGDRSPHKLALAALAARAAEVAA